MAGVRVYWRALQPIHVRIVADLGVPRGGEGRVLEGLGVAMLANTTQPGEAGQADVLGRCFVEGGARVAVGVVRIWKRGLREVRPKDMASTVLCEEAQGGEVAVATDAATDSGDVEDSTAFVHYLIRVIGLCTWRCPTASSSSSAAVLTVRDVVRTGSVKGMPGVVRRVCEGGEGNEGGDVGAIGGEVVGLVQEMVGWEGWKGVVIKVFGEVLRDFWREFEQPKDQLCVADGLAVLAILGGHVEELRAGVSVSMTHTDVGATVVGFDEQRGYAGVVMQGGGGVVRISAEDMLVRQSCLKKEGWRAIKESGLVEEVIVPMALKLLKERKGEESDEEEEEEEMEEKVEDEKTEGSNVEMSATELAMALDSEKKDDEVDNTSFADGDNGEGGGVSSDVPPRVAAPESRRNNGLRGGSMVSQLVFSQARARLAKVLYRLSLEPGWISTLVKWPGLIQDVGMLAVVADETPTLSTLEETEARVWHMRKRFFGMLTKGGREKVEGLKEGEVVKSALSVNEPVGGGFILCPFCGRDNLDEVALAEHILESHPMNNRSAICPICLAQRGDQGLHDLTSHMDIYHLDGQHIDVVNLGVGRQSRDRLEQGAEEDATAAQQNVEETRETLLSDMEIGTGHVSPKSDLIEQLMQMGFREEWCALALRENSNDVEYASTWIVDNLDFLTNLGEGSFGQMSMREMEDEDEEKLLDQEGGLLLGGGEEGEGKADEGDDMLADLKEEMKEEGGDGFGDDVMDGNDARLQLVDNLEAEGAVCVFEENYFSSNLTVTGGFENRGSASSATGGTSGGSGGGGCGMYSNYSDVVVVGSNASPGYRNKQIEEDVASMEMRELLRNYCDGEKLLAILHARACVSQLLMTWTDVYGGGEEVKEGVRGVFGNQEVLVQLLKVTCFRGVQFPLLQRTSRTDNVSVNGLTNAASALRPFICSMLKEREGGALNKSGEGEDELGLDGEGGEGSFGNMLLNCCLDDIEAAASIEAFDEMAWFARILNTSDSQALLQPSVELAGWLLDLLLYCKSPCMYKIFTFQRIASCLLSANVPIKDMCMHVLRSIIVEWFSVLERGGGRGGGGEGGGEDESMNGEVIPSAREMVSLIADCIPLGRLKRIASQRAAEERRHERVFMSQFTRRMTALTVATDDLLEFIGGMEKGGGEEEEEGVPMVEELSMAVLSENALSITWSRGGAGEEEEEDDDDIDLWKYEVEMATKTVLDGEAALNYTNIYSGYDEECVVENLLPSRKYVRERERASITHLRAYTSRKGDARVSEASMSHLLALALFPSLQRSRTLTRARFLPLQLTLASLAGTRAGPE